MSLNINTQRITATDSAGTVLAYAEENEGRWTIHAHPDVRMDDRLNRALSAEATTRFGAATAKGGLNRMPGAAHPKPVAQPNPETGGLFCPEGTALEDVRQALRDVATIVDGWLKADADALQTAVDGIIGTVARAGAPRLVD